MQPKDPGAGPEGQGARISVVIRTLNSSATLPKVLARLPLRPGDELIVVDSGSQDETVKIARDAGARVVTMARREFTYGRSLNIGFREACNDWILSLSSHCIPGPENLLDLYRTAILRFPSEVAAAVGPMLYSDLDAAMSTGITLFDRADFASGFGIGAGNPNCLYRRDVWTRHPFDEMAEASEDYEWYVWAVREGWTLAIVHAATVYYRSRRGAAYFFNKGRIDFRAGQRLISLPCPRLSVVCSHSAKLVLHALLGKMPYPCFTASFWHYIGTYYESRWPREGSTPKAR